jgi:hypothetical protein
MVHRMSNAGDSLEGVLFVEVGCKLQHETPLLDEWSSAFGDR